MIRELIYGEHQPYADFPGRIWQRESPNWGSSHEWLTEAVVELRPKLIIEVGSWLGASAIRMADQMMASGIEGEILCVDTWLGGVDHWLAPERDDMLRLHYGRPALYYSFLGNVMAAGHTERIVPLTLDSVNAARWLTAKNVQAELIYIDASHEAADVRRDLEAYWLLLAPGGMMLIDDITGHFRGLVQAVEEFVEDHALVIELSREKGRLRKGK